MKGRGTKICCGAALVLVCLVFIVPPVAAGSQLDTSHPVSFFTNLASRLLRVEMNLDLHRLQVYPTNQYTPAVHRLLQLTANVWDAIHPTNDAAGPLPTVFRPIFCTEGSNVFIRDYVEWPFFNPFEELTAGPLDLALITNAAAQVRSNSLIYGVPLVIGARKGLPNFNELASESVVQITRKVQLRKSGPGGGHLINQTNQVFIIGISNALGVEFWNSYVSNYSRPVEVVALYRGSLQLTNDYGYSQRLSSSFTGQAFLPASGWPAWNPQLPTGPSFLVPLRTNQIIVPDLAWSQVSGSLQPVTDTFEVTPSTPVPLPFPRWGLTITNRVVAYIRDSSSGRLLDYVQLSSLTGHRDITGEMATPPQVQGFDGLWGTNILNGFVSGVPGVIQQIEISKGNPPLSSSEWQSYGLNLPGGATRAMEIAKFLAFMSPNNIGSYTDPDTSIRYDAVNTSNVAVTPFSPTWKQSLPMLWQVNDPLVHYASGEMEFLERSFVPVQWIPVSGTNVPTLGNIGRVNERYRPWAGNPFQTGVGTQIGGDPNAFNAVFKDPLIRSSHDWDFPKDEPLSLAMLRRVHRGTPWQTVYLKSGAVTNFYHWQSWTGNRNVPDAEHTQPTRDWKIAVMIASLINTNDPRTLLSVNERDTNAWLAILDGTVALTNSATDEMLDNILTQFDPITIESDSHQASVVATGINRERTRTILINGKNVFIHANGTFNELGEILAVPELSLASPFLNFGIFDESTGRNIQLEYGLNDEAYERIPVQLLPRLRSDSFGSIASDADGWRLRFTGMEDFTYAVEMSTNLTTWQTIVTNRPVGGVFDLELPAGGEQHFFRSVLLP